MGTKGETNEGKVIGTEKGRRKRKSQLSVRRNVLILYFGKGHHEYNIWWVCWKRLIVVS